MKRRIVAIAAALLVILLALWIVHTVRARYARAEYSGTIETREIEIGSKVGGRVTGVFAEEGQTIRAGTVLVRFECDQLQAQRAEAAAAITEAQANLDRMLRGNRPEEIAQAQAAAETARAAFEEARNGARPQELDQAQADYAAAKADSANAAGSYERMAKLAAGDVISRQQFDDARDRRDAAAQHAEAVRQRLA